jgi:hypothetical protein
MLNFQTVFSDAACRFFGNPNPFLAPHRFLDKNGGVLSPFTNKVSLNAEKKL